jgi:hypothetical protein
MSWIRESVFFFDKPCLSDDHDEWKKRGEEETIFS